MEHSLSTSPIRICGRGDWDDKLDVQWDVQIEGEMEQCLLTGEEHKIRAGGTLRENLMREPMTMGEVLVQPEEPAAGALLTEPPVEQSTAQVK